MKILELIFLVVLCGWLSLGLMYYATKHLWRRYPQTRTWKSAIQLLVACAVLFGMGAWMFYFGFIVEDISTLLELWNRRQAPA